MKYNMPPKRSTRSAGEVLQVQGQAKQHSRQLKKLHPAPSTPELACSRSGDAHSLSGQLSPAKKLARLMREHPVRPPHQLSGNRELNVENGGINTQLKSKPSKLGKVANKASVKQGRTKPKQAHGQGVSHVSQNSDVGTGEQPSKKQSRKKHSHERQPKKDHNNISELSNEGKREHPEDKASHSGQTKKRVRKARHKPSQVVSKSDPNPAGGDIAALLRLGEGPSAEEAVMSDDSDWEAVENAAHSSDLATKGFVEVTLPSDMALLKKKKKKAFDVEAHLKRQMSRVRREVQVLIHKTHLLCLLSRSLQINSLLNTEVMLACAMSMLPSKYAYPPKRVSLTYVEKFLMWFRQKVPLESAGDGQKPSEDVFRTLESRLRVKKAFTSLELVCLFVLILRAIGVDCRLVMSLQPSPLKPAPVSAASAAAAPPKSASKVKKEPGGKTPKRESAKASTGARKATPGSQRKQKKSAAPASASAAATRPSFERKGKRRPRPASDSTDDYEPAGPSFRSRPDRRVLSSSSEPEPGGGRPARDATDHWAEVYVEEELRWLCVDVTGGGVHCVSQIRKRASCPMAYVLGLDNSGHVKDLTARYDPKWHSTTRKLRVEPDWWERAVRAWKGGQTRRDKEEDEELEKDLQERPMPQSVAEFKDHPLYALERHLLKFQAIYPPSSVPLGYLGKGERRTPIYARECVHTLHSRETWIKQARSVRPDEEPYKVVKARPKWDRVLQRAITDQPLPVFGRWQTEQYVPPTAEGGLVPRNAYGNVELFKPCMLPGGTVHLAVDGLSRVAKKLDIDCAPAMVGWDYHCGGSHPVFEGYVVCEEFQDTLMEAWEQEQREARRRQRERHEKRVLDNWRRLTRGLLIRQRLANKYSFQDGSAAKQRPGAADQPAAASKHAQPARPSQQQQPKAESKLEPESEPGLGLKREPKEEPKPKPAPRHKTRLAAKLKAKLEPKQEPEEEPELTKEEAARRVEASIAGMALGRLVLSSDSEPEEDDVGAPAAAPAKRRRRPVAAAPSKRRRRPVAADEPEPGPEPAAPGRSRRAVDYREAAGSDTEPPMRNDDLTSDEEQPFVKAATRADSSDDFEGF